jgi:outer membrane protein assembly factor BamB
MSIPNSTLATLLAGLLLGPSFLRAGDQALWGQDPTRNMVSSERGLPIEVDPASGKGVKWTAELGSSTYSTPVVAGGRVLIGTNNGNPRDPRHKGDRGVLMCFAEDTGRFLWQLVVPKRDEDAYLDWPNTGMVGPATVEGDRVYVVNNRNEVMCLDLQGLANGNDGPFTEEARHMTHPDDASLPLGPTDADVLWRYDIPKELGVHNHDAAQTSIVIHGPNLYVGTGNGTDNTHRKIRAPDAPALIVLDKRTGRLLARDREPIAPRTIHSSWSSVSLGEVGGRTLAFFGGGDGVCYAFEALPVDKPASEPVTLKLAWRFDCDPEGPKEDIFRYQDNRREGPSNISSMPVFDQGRVYVTAGGDLWHGKPQCWLKCLDAAKTGDITAAGPMWSYPLGRYCLATPAVREGLAYVTDCAGQVHAVDTATGKAAWVHKLGGEIWSSPLVADGKVYVTTRNGTLGVLAAGREKKVLATVDFGEPFSASPVAANGTLYVATASKLYALKAAR